MNILKRLMKIISAVMLVYIVVRIVECQEIINGITQNITAQKVLIIVVAVILFFLVHLVRMFRMYILLIEEKMPLKKFVELYIKTTFVDNVIPFKLGEIYKWICYGEKLKSYSAGLSLIWLERFFDSIVLIVLMFIATKFNVASTILVILSIFIIFSIIVYVSFESTYKYFNALVLEKGKSKRSKWYLETIEEFKKIYTKAKRMLSYRGTPLILLTVVVWAIEYFLAYLIFKVIFAIDFSLGIFTNYINDVFVFFNTNNAKIFDFYMLLMIIVFALIYMVLLLKKRKGK